MKNENLCKKIHLKHWINYLCSLFSIILILTQGSLFAQTPANQYKLGVNVLTDEQYAQLPKANWDTLTKYSNAAKTIALKSASASGNIVMLNTPSIGDQGTLQGSCVGWAVGYAATGILTYPKYNCWGMANRSPSYVYNQIKASSDCLSGSQMTDALNLVTSQGDCSWYVMPYVNNDCSTLPSTAQKYDASKNNASKWYSLVKNDLTGIKQALDLGYPVPIACAVYQSFYDMWNSSGIWSSNSGAFYGYHAICIVGYDDVNQMVKVQNSWGYGGDLNNPGFFWIPYTMIQNSCLREAYVVYGMNAAYPESISGSTSVCSSGSTYTVDNVPSGCYVSWNQSSNLTYVSGQNTNLYTVKASGSGAGTVQATIVSTTCGSVTLPSYKVIAGVPTSPTIYFQQYGNACEFEAYTTSRLGVSTYFWSENGTNWINDDYIYSYNTFQPKATVTLYLKVQNQCGTSPVYKVAKTMPIAPSGCLKSAQINENSTKVSEVQNSINIFPNPTSGSITINFGKEYTKLRVSLINLEGKVVFISNENNISENNYDWSALSKGLYILVLQSDEGITMHKVILR